ncbi:hypothetical protein [Pelobacter seleniigenes]|uniref:hypothetical protein n=1 Tax=Pelobacter seleniigenes TaxID=407188 RepID=UPI0012B9703A|nr:hypothetical protein [Pelobacter seleniigenes]
MKRIIFTPAVFVENLLTILIFFISASYALGAGPLVEFDNITPSSSSTSRTSNTSFTYAETGSGTDGWTSKTEIGSTGNYVEFYRYLNTYNNSHLGWEAWGYLDISSIFSHSGNSLHAHITGGKSDSFPNGSGAVIYSKQDFIDYVGDPNSGENLGQPYIYFSTTDGTHTTVFPGASGADELSAYIYMPSDIAVDTGANYPTKNISFGPYLYDQSGHYYNRFGLNGGGWIHTIVDNHPQHNNGWSSDSATPYDGYAIRTFTSANFIQKISHMYIALNTAITPADYYIDELTFRTLTGEASQNFETLNSPAIGYYSDGHFEVSFMDKYVNLKSGLTIEGRYSFSPITNANWDSATLIDVQEYSGGFTITESVAGQFKKPNRFYRETWAPFRVQSFDEPRLKAGTTIYFAFKDVGNLDSNGNPIKSCSTSGCRDYASGNFDWNGDSAALTKIRTIEYVINSAGQKILQPAGNLKIVD